MAQYTNPTAFPQQNPQFGSSSQFNIPGGIGAPFPFEQQRQQQQDLLAGYTAQIQGQPALQDIYHRLAQQYMIPQLTEQVQTYDTMAAGLANQIAALPGDVSDRTTESLVSDPQRTKMIQTQQQPLMEGLSAAGNLGSAARQGLQTATGQAGQMAALEFQEQDRQLQPWEMQYDMQNVMQSREFSGWSGSMGMELDRLMANQSAGLGWSQGEAERANRLQQIKEEYSQRLNYNQKIGEQIAKFYSYI